MGNIAYFSGAVKAVSSAKHPLQTAVQFVLTDFLPNKNNQGIPKTEAENVMSTAIQMPIKMKFDGMGPDGHAGAKPMGPISRAWLEDDKIIAEAIIWNDEYKDVVSYLKSAWAENESIGTSWEMYYQDSVNEDGIEWLQGVTVAGSCVVKDPAYGKDRTRLLSVAELNMNKSNAATADEVSETLSNMSDLFSLLNDLWYELYEEERREELAVSAENALDQVRAMIAEWKNRKKAMSETTKTVEELEAEKAELETKLTGVESELTELRNYKQVAEADKAFAERKAHLDPYLDETIITARRGMILELSEDLFTTYVADLKAVAEKNKSAVAENKSNVRVPDTTGATAITIEDLAKALNGVK